MIYSKQQIKIINSKESRVLVHAVAGSGKTTTIKALIKKAINTGVPIDKILACTFTRKMARELKEANPRLTWCDTIHGVCLRIVEKYKELLGYDRLILIDEIENDDLIKKTIKRSTVRITISRAKELISEYCYAGVIKAAKKTEEIFLKTYLREIKEGNIITYGLMELYAKQIIKQKPDLGFELIIIDEYQDTSAAEIEIIEMLVKKRIIMVGDAMQGIYSFRGANPDIIKHCHPDIVYEMDYSYRMDKSIAMVANKIIDMNTFGYTSRIKAKDTPGSASLIDDCSPEAVRISLEMLLDHYDPQDIFVITRTNREISYLINLFEDMPIDKDMSAVKNMKYLSYLDIATRAYYNGYYNYGMLRLLKLFDYRDAELIYLENSGKDIYDMVKNDIPVREFNAIMRRDMPFYRKAETMLPMFEKQRGEYDHFMVKVLPYISHITDDLEFMDWYASISVSDFMPKDKVAIITAHISKGMETDAVLIPYVKDGHFPHRRGDYQEELRVLYVAMTRARHQLIIHHENSSVINNIIGS